jgi:hypothetical protein
MGACHITARGPCPALSAMRATRAAESPVGKVTGLFWPESLPPNAEHQSPRRKRRAQPSTAPRASRGKRRDTFRAPGSSAASRSNAPQAWHSEPCTYRGLRAVGAGRHRLAPMSRDAPLTVRTQVQRAWVCFRFRQPRPSLAPVPHG